MGDEVVPRWIVALSLFALPVAANAAAPLPSAGWWEKVTVRMAGDGETKNCQYSTNLPSGTAPDCQVVGGSVSVEPASAKDGLTTITFERRFSPGGAPASETVMQKGDTLLGRKVMVLAIDGEGKVSGCREVDRDGDTGLAYGCEEASKEQFEATSAIARQGFMTILVYGHEEHMV